MLRPLVATEAQSIEHDCSPATSAGRASALPMRRRSRASPGVGPLAGPPEPRCELPVRVRVRRTAI